MLEELLKDLLNCIIKNLEEEKYSQKNRKNLFERFFFKKKLNGFIIITLSNIFFFKLILKYLQRMFL